MLLLSLPARVLAGRMLWLPDTAQFLLGLGFFLLAGGQVAAAEREFVTPPDAAQQALQVPPGLVVELIAAEPLVESPVALAFDADGRLFVAENRGYPVGPPEGDPPWGRISELRDTDGDGRIDARETFAEGLTFPNGLLPYQGGWVVTCAPDVLYLKDSDGDGRAEIREVLLTGFSTSGSTQLRVSHPTWGPDNWIYLAGGLTGGRITSPRHPDQPAVEIGRADLRFRPDGSAFQSVEGGAQFGQTFDDYGQRFICYNRVQVQQVLASSAAWRRQPQLRFTDIVHNCPTEVLAEPLRGHGAAARLYPLTTHVTTADSHAGTFTAACAVTLFRGDNLPREYQGAVLSCDPTGNLVHADRLMTTRAAATAVPLLNKQELLASTDPWCRPVFLANAPDGTLYVCDMSRKTIEHPDYLPTEIRKQTDFETGRHTGRIWRVRTAAIAPEVLRTRGRPQLAGQGNAELVGHLRSANGWHRDTARRLLLERQARDMLPRLLTLLRDPTAAPEAIAAAFSVAREWHNPAPAEWRSLLTNEHVGVRSLAVRQLATDPLLALQWSALAPGLLQDPAPLVRFQMALAIPPAVVEQANGTADERHEHELCTALADLGLRSGDDRWTRAAVLSASTAREGRLLAAVEDRLSRSEPANGPHASAEIRPERHPAHPFLRDLGRIAAVVLPETELVAGSARWLSQTRGEWTTRVALATGLAQGLRERGRVPAGEAAWSRIPLTAEQAFAWQSLWERTAREIQDTLQSPRVITPESGDTQASAPDSRPTGLSLTDLPDQLEFVAEGNWEQAEPVLQAAVGSADEASCLAALRILAAIPREPISGWLLEPEEFARRSPRVRAEILATLLAQPVHARGLLAALDDRRIPTTAVDAFRRRQLLQHPDQEIRSRAEVLLGSPAGDRAAVYEEWKGVAELPGHSGRGREVFARVCANCHRLDRTGHAVGPDLFGVRNQPKGVLLLHILVPDQEITEGFGAYSVVTTEGRVLSGLVTGSTPEQITLRLPQGIEETLPRSRLQEFAAAGTSLMPTGLERDLTREQMADLLAFLKGERAPD